MKKLVMLTCLIAALFLAVTAPAAVLIDLSAENLAEGDLTAWVNEGTAGGTFLTADYDATDEVVDPNAIVEIVDGRKAVSFPGGAWMESDITAPEAITGSNPWTIMVWAYDTAGTTEDCLFQWADRGGNTAHFNYGERALTFWNDVFYTSRLPYGTWKHVAATYDGTTVRLYVDGIPNATADRSLTINSNQSMRIARAMPDVYGTHPFDGSIASIQMHDVALTQTEIQDAMGVFAVAGELTPAGITLMEGNGSENITLQIDENYMTEAGPTTDLEVTLSFAGTYADASIGTSSVGDPYVVTVPAATYGDPIIIPIIAEDDAVLEGTHQVRIEAVVTAGDPDYMAAAILPVGGLSITIKDNDFPQYPPPAFIDGAYVDDFDDPWDFGIGVAGLWDGIMNAENIISAETITTPGLLTIDGTGNFNGNETTAPFLYTEVTGDFVAEVHQIAPMTSGGGLMVRLGGDLALGGAGEDNMWLAAWSSWDVGSIFWPVDNGGRPEQDITWDGADGPTWARVERRGAEFYWSRSYDGVNWLALPSANPAVRNDMNVETLQVGIVQAFAGDPVEYDYFKLKPARGSINGTLNLTEIIGESGNVQFQLHAEDFPAPIEDLEVTLTAMGVTGADPNSEPNDIMIGDSAKSMPYTFTIPAADYALPQDILVTAVIDTDPEPDQLLTMEATVASADPNWNGLFISSDVLISVLETPGLIVDAGDGVQDQEGDGGDSFSVRLKIPPTAPVSVAVADTADPAQVNVAPATLVFDSANWQIPQAVTVTAVDDAVLENDPHTTTVSLTPTDGGAYDLLAPSTVAVTILENECGAWGYLWADFDNDCDIDLADLGIMAAEWLSCTNPYDPGCVDLR